MDQVLINLHNAKIAAQEEIELGSGSRELSVALTQIDTAILWRQADLELKHKNVAAEELEPVDKDSVKVYINGNTYYLEEPDRKLTYRELLHIAYGDELPVGKNKITLVHHDKEPEVLAHDMALIPADGLVITVETVPND